MSSAHLTTENNNCVSFYRINDIEKCMLPYVIVRKALISNLRSIGIVASKSIYPLFTSHTARICGAIGRYLIAIVCMASTRICFYQVCAV